MADMSEVFKKVFGCDPIIIRLGKEDPRVCDYCNTTLVAPGGTVVKESFLTDYGLMCSNCIGEIGAICVYSPGEDVSDRQWYRGC